MPQSAAPIVNDLNAPFWEGAAARRLMLPHCARTGRAFWPPSPASPFVTGGAVEWRAAEPHGAVIAVAIYRRAFHESFAALMPYGIALVELDAGPRLHAHVAHPDAPDAPRSGDRVRLGFAPILADGMPVPVIERAERP